MDKNQPKKRLLLLVEPQPTGLDELTGWLMDRGMRTWWATDVSHAIEELSDFTVKNRPDVVMLEASSISECLRELTTGLGGLFRETDVSVIAMSDSGMQSRTEPCFATNIAQLETIIDRETGPRASI